MTYERSAIKRRIVRTARSLRPRLRCVLENSPTTLLVMSRCFHDPILAALRLDLTQFPLCPLPILVRLRILDTLLKDDSDFLQSFVASANAATLTLGPARVHGFEE